MATLKNLKLKTNICRRVLKELHSYETEVEREAAKTTSMKNNNAEPHDLKQQENVLAESKMMIPDCRKRLELALGNLESAVTEAEEEPIEGEDAALGESKELISKVKRLLESV